MASFFAGAASGRQRFSSLLNPGIWLPGSHQNYPARSAVAGTIDLQAAVLLPLQAALHRPVGNERGQSSRWSISATFSAARRGYRWASGYMANFRWDSTERLRFSIELIVQSDITLTRQLFQRSSSARRGMTVQTPHC